MKRTYEQQLRRELRKILNSMVLNHCIRDFPTKDTIVEMVIVGVLDVNARAKAGAK